MPFDSSTIVGKKCIVVAPSGYLNGRGARSGEFVDSFDFVVKCTRTIDITDDNYELGKRCDLWFGLPFYAKLPWQLSDDIHCKFAAKHLFFQPKLDRYKEIWDESIAHFKSRNLAQQVSWSEAPTHLYERLIKQFDCIPFTGVFAIFVLLELGASEVYAYGHDFYLTGYFDNVAPAQLSNSDWHKLKPQMQFLWHLLQTEPRFKCDKNLSQLLTREFGSEAKKEASSQALLASDCDFFLSQSPSQTLIFRSNNIQCFTKNLQIIKSFIDCEFLFVLAQISVVDELALHVKNIVTYPSDKPFDSQLALSLTTLHEHVFHQCLVPYNGEKLSTYLEIFKVISALKIKRTYLVSQRGALIEISNVNRIVEEIEEYLSVRERYQLLASKYDRKHCV
jgi:hypothetical protein